MSRIRPQRFCDGDCHSCHKRGRAGPKKARADLRRGSGAGGPDPLACHGLAECIADVLTPEQLETLGDIADAISKHLAEEHEADFSPE